MFAMPSSSGHACVCFVHMLSARSIQRQDALARLSPERHFLVPAHAEFRRCVRAYVRAPASEVGLHGTVFYLKHQKTARERERRWAVSKRERDEGLFKKDREARRKREEDWSCVSCLSHRCSVSLSNQRLGSLSLPFPIEPN